MTTLNERLIAVMEHYGYSSSRFADKLQIIRSTISHIIGGRNKPGIDLIQKVLEHFPEVNAEWLLMGKGEMLSSSKIKDTSVENPERVYTREFDNKSDLGPEIEKSNTSQFVPQYPLIDSIIFKEGIQPDKIKTDTIPEFRQMDLLDVIKKPSTESLVDQIQIPKTDIHDMHNKDVISENDMEEDKSNPAVKPKKENVLTNNSDSSIKRITIYFDNGKYQDFLPD